MRKLFPYLAGAVVAAAVSAAALAQTPIKPGIPVPPPVDRPKGLGEPKRPLPRGMPNLRIVRVEPTDRGTSLGRWGRVTVRNVGTAATTLDWAPIRARIVPTPPSATSTFGELSLYRCALPSGWDGRRPPCGTAGVGPLAAGAEVTVEAFLQKAPFPGVSVPYTVELWVDACGPSWLPDRPDISAPTCRVAESDETDNGFTLRVNTATGTGG
jgi:hypothetical protein